MKLVYGVKDKPRFPQLIVFAIQQLLAIMAATIAVPMITSGHYDNFDLSMSTAAALIGAGFGTIVYLLFTKFRSPVFLGSSYAFLGSIAAAFAGAATVSVGSLGLIIGAVFAGLVYVVIAIFVKLAGVIWINKLMPAVVIGPTVSIIGLSLAGNAVGDLKTAPAGGNTLIAVLCGLVTLAVVILCSTFGKKTAKLIPFILGILAGYAVATIFTVIGMAADIDALKVINFEPLKALVADGVKVTTFFTLPRFTFLTAFGAFDKLSGAYIATLAVAYVPVAFVVFAEHIADHKNISSIIEKDLPYYRKMMSNKYSFELHEKIKGIITDKITAGSKLYADYAKDPRYRFVVVYIVSGTCDYFREWILSDDRVPLAELNAIIEKLILGGLNGIQHSLRPDLPPSPLPERHD